MQLGAGARAAGGVVHLPRRVLRFSGAVSRTGPRRRGRCRPRTSPRPRSRRRSRYLIHAVAELEDEVLRIDDGVCGQVGDARVALAVGWRAPVRAVVLDVENSVVVPVVGVLGMRSPPVGRRELPPVEPRLGVEVEQGPAGELTRVVALDVVPLHPGVVDGDDDVGASDGLLPRLVDAGPGDAEQLLGVLGRRGLQCCSWSGISQAVRDSTSSDPRRCRREATRPTPCSPDRRTDPGRRTAPGKEIGPPAGAPGPATSAATVASTSKLFVVDRGCMHLLERAGADVTAYRRVLRRELAPLPGPRTVTPVYRGRALRLTSRASRRCRRGIQNAG